MLSKDVIAGAAPQSTRTDSGPASSGETRQLVEPHALAGRARKGVLDRTVIVKERDGHPSPHEWCTDLVLAKNIS